MINTLSPYIGMGLLILGVFALYLTTEDEKKTRKSGKHKH